MEVLVVGGVNEAYSEGLELLLAKGQKGNSRNGEVLSLARPLAVTYTRPLERVLFDPLRDANPFFHLFESLWLLAGRNDARWLDRFIGDFSSRFAEEDGILHASYGFRWRKHFDVEGGGNPNMPDQLDTVVRLLRANPEDRRVVIQMWDPVADLAQDKKDIPCNLTVIPRITHGRLDLTVFNRSNDLVWGLTGANAVQFSVLLEYLAGRIGVAPGIYTQISTNAHVYLNTIRPMVPYTQAYPATYPMGQDWDKWDEDLATFFDWAEDWECQPPTYPNNPWFENTAQPLFAAHAIWKQGDREDKEEALALLKDEIFDMAPDWKQAAISWMLRRLNKLRAV